MIDMSDIISALEDRWIKSSVLLRGSAEDLDKSASFVVFESVEALSSGAYFRGPLRTAGIILEAVRSLPRGGGRLAEGVIYKAIESAGWWQVNHEWANRNDEAAWKHFITTMEAA